MASDRTVRLLVVAGRPSLFGVLDPVKGGAGRSQKANGWRSAGGPVWSEDRKKHTLYRFGQTYMFGFPHHPSFPVIPVWDLHLHLVPQ